MRKYFMHHEDEDGPVPVYLASDVEPLIAELQRVAKDAISEAAEYVRVNWRQFLPKCEGGETEKSKIGLDDL